MRRTKITYEPNYMGHPIMADFDEGYGCSLEMLGRILNVCEWYVGRHSKAYFFRMDLRFPDVYPITLASDNALFKRFAANYVLALKRSKFSPLYVWAREQASSPHHHYHLALWLDGSKTQSPHNHLIKAENLWASALSINSGTGLIHGCGSGVMLKRDSPDFKTQFDKIYHWCSYLTKISTKGRAPFRIREYGCSQVFPITSSLAPHPPLEGQQ